MNMQRSVCVDVFLAIVCHDYVGTEDALSESKMINVICQKLSKLSM